MEHLEIVSTTTNVQAKQIINGNSVYYSYNYTEGAAPLAIVFTVQRNSTLEMTGTFYPGTEKFEVNTTSYKTGDGALQESIFETCKAIVLSLMPEPEE